MDKSTFYMTNGLLWMWPTHLVNMTTNAMMLVGRPTEKIFGSAALQLVTKDAAKKAELSSISRQAMREYTYMVSSIGDGLKSALEAFRRGDSILTPHNSEYFNSSSTGIAADALNWKPVNSVWDVVENAWTSATWQNIVGLPTRTIGGADEFFKLLRYRSVVQSRAYVKAVEKGLNPQETKAYIEKSLNKAIDPASGQALDQTALLEAQTTTFQQDLNYATTIGGSLGRGIQNLRKSAPITALILPFVKTPVNVLRYGIKMTPGLNLAQKEYRQMLSGQMGAEAKAHAMGQMAIGSLFASFVAHQTLNGTITGAGPKDQKLKQELMATGWRPYSFVSTDAEGNKQYLQFSRFDPVATAMGLVADVVEMYQKDPERDYSDVALAISIAMAKNLGKRRSSRISTQR
ncbi:hypothetical protein HGG76_02560 [Ochrobactrum tritici]|uniref:Uncharacterized protein n=1 Tax=Brucella tritici TaxID=94626 RepID=A0A7X6JB33_9HYPH|nr:hypothetical protein [Brucella tritici]